MQTQHELDVWAFSFGGNLDHWKTHHNAWEWAMVWTLRDRRQRLR